jgi:NAD(P)H-flavin reductase
MVGLPGIGEVPLSISSEPWREKEFDHTIRNVGGVTGVLCSLRKQDGVHIRGPYGTGWPMTEAAGKDIVFIAGGIGLAPLRPAVSRVLRNRKNYGKVNIVYGARTPEDMLFIDEFDGWSSSPECRLLLSADRVSDPSKWKHKVGVVLSLFDEIDADPYSCIVMTCGPEIMMRFVVRGLIHRGYAQDAIYVSMERRMKCGIGHCGHCQLGPKYVCLDGPVFRYVDIKTYPDSIV